METPDIIFAGMWGAGALGACAWGYMKQTGCFDFEEYRIKFVTTYYRGMTQISKKVHYHDHVVKSDKIQLNDRWERVDRVDGDPSHDYLLIRTVQLLKEAA